MNPIHCSPDLSSSWTLDENFHFLAYPATGYERADVLGKNPRVFQSGRQDPAFHEQMWRSILDTGHHDPQDEQQPRTRRQRRRRSSPFRADSRQRCELLAFAAREQT